ncbi:DUF1073 domain-containing protein [Phormidium sp. FACHB-592]|uniref:NAD(+)--protein-arginine ADP-ribosyltransferase n=1 Tax=Stenomitos frigidus AS-A4 TaxID=2933935 RepID=A0ABV0KEF2_9CYAN|nr:anti-CBASS Acb1 family protein [Phormidium sp. FACHB-592]MBD2076217.1 DUF1073 domain-containing protein [Phormidium sp. FACHB-592]
MATQNGNGNGNGSVVAHWDDMASLGAALSGGIYNPQTGMGMVGTDPSRSASVFYGGRLEREQQESLFRNYGLLRKVVCNIPRAATYRWGTPTLPTGSSAKLNALIDALNQIPIHSARHVYKGAKKGFQEALKTAFLTGNSALVMDADDGLPLDQPLNLKRLNSVRKLWLFSRWQLVPDDRSLTVLRQSEHFEIVDHRAMDAPEASWRIHRSRVLWFRGAELIDGYTGSYNQGCDDSILQAMLESFYLYTNGVKGAGRMLEDFDFYVHKITGLLGKLESNPQKAQQVISARLEINRQRRSNFRDMVIDKENEEIAPVSRQVGGYSDMLDHCKNYLLASTDYPPSVLFGEFSAGLNATGMETSERQTWNDTTAQAQQDKCEDNVLTLANVLCAAKSGPTQGNELKGLAWHWHVLYAPSPEENAGLQSQFATMLSTLAQVEQSVIGQVGIRTLWGQNEFNQNLVLPKNYVKFLDDAIAAAVIPPPPEEEMLGEAELEGEEFEGEEQLALEGNDQDQAIADELLDDRTLLDSNDVFFLYHLDASTRSELLAKVKAKNESLAKGKKFNAFGKTTAEIRAFVGEGGDSPASKSKGTAKPASGKAGKYQTSKTSGAIANAIARKTGAKAEDIEQDLRGKIQKAIDKKRRDLKKAGKEVTDKDLRQAARDVVKIEAKGAIAKAKGEPIAPEKAIVKKPKATKAKAVETPEAAEPKKTKTAKKKVVEVEPKPMEEKPVKATKLKEKAKDKLNVGTETKPQKQEKSGSKTGEVRGAAGGREPVPETDEKERKRALETHDVIKGDLSRDQKIDRIAEITGLDKTKAEFALDGISTFTSDAGEIRQFEIGQPLKSDDQEYKDGVKESADGTNLYVRSMPKFKGEIHRGLKFNTDEERDKFISSVSNGFELQALSSFSSDPAIALRFSVGMKKKPGVVISVKSNTKGASVKGVSSVPAEDEIVVPKGAKYKVVKQYVKDGTVHLDVEEDDDVKPQVATPPVNSKAVPANKPKQSPRADSYEQINFKPPVEARQACKKGLELHKAGKSGSGIEPATIKEAMAIAQGKAVTPEKVEKAYRWFARNSRFASAPEGSGAHTDWLIWGGEPFKTFVGKVKRQMEAAQGEQSDSFADERLKLDATCGKGWVGSKPPGCTRAKKGQPIPTAAKPETTPVAKETAQPSKAAPAEQKNRTAGSHSIFSRRLVQAEGDEPEKADIEAMASQLEQKLGLTKKEAKETISSVTSFTGDNYTAIRKAEREGKPTKEGKAINRYIEKAPKYDGEIYRGLSFKTTKELDDFLNTAKEGSSMKPDAVSSFSSDRSIAERFSKDSGNQNSVVLKVKQNRSGASIQDLTLYPEEGEVLVPKNTTYRVASVKRKGNTVEIELEDTAPPLEKSKVEEKKPAKETKVQSFNSQAAIAKFKEGKPLSQEEAAFIKQLLG